MQQAVQRAEAHEGAELQHLHHQAVHDLLDLRLEHQGVEADLLVHGPVSVDDAALARPLDGGGDERQTSLLRHLPLQRGSREFLRYLVQILRQALGRNADDVVHGDPYVHSDNSVSLGEHGADRDAEAAAAWLAPR